MDTITKSEKLKRVAAEIDDMIKVAVDAEYRSFEKLQNGFIAPEEYRMAWSHSMNATVTKAYLYGIRTAVLSARSEEDAAAAVRYHYSQICCKGEPDGDGLIPYAQGTVRMCLKFLIEKYFTK